MPEVLTFTRQQVPAVLAAIAEQARAGAVDERVRAFLADASAELGRRGDRQPEAVAIFREAYRRAGSTVTYLPDPNALERVQAAGFTLERGYGDCSSAPALVLALALGVGLSGRVVLASFADQALHAFAEVELDGRMTPADLAGALELGEEPPAPAGAVFHALDVGVLEEPGVGFLGDLIGGLFGLSAAKRQARAAEAQADAAVRAAQEQRAAQESAAAAQVRAAREQNQAAVQVATIQALVENRRARGGEAIVARVADVASKVAPLAGAVLLAWAVRPVLVNLTSPRRRTAPRPAATPAQMPSARPARRPAGRLARRRPARRTRKGARRAA